MIIVALIQDFLFVIMGLFHDILFVIIVGLFQDILFVIMGLFVIAFSSVVGR